MIQSYGSDLLYLRPAVMQDKRKIYLWMSQSNLTKTMFGPPLYPETPIPSWDEFNRDYQDHYFDGSKPLLGQCFVIVYKFEEIGQINYNEFNLTDRSTEIDIWMADLKYTSQGLGTEAIKIFCQFLKQTLDCHTIFIAPSKRNQAAIKAYRKAGFFETEHLPPGFVPDYKDSVLLSLKLCQRNLNCPAE